MTDTELELFKTEFKSIVYYKGFITNHNKYVRKLHVWDKNGSHKNAILKALAQKKEFETKFDEMLKGKTYDEWLAMSKKLSALKSRLKQSVTKKQAIQQQISQLIFSPIKTTNNATTV